MGRKGRQEVESGQGGKDWDSMGIYDTTITFGLWMVSGFSSSSSSSSSSFRCVVRYYLGR